ncbi:uncharacterized protein LOC116935156 [Daphnia magna]|nr:uncharacterized protein LOC116935156 [Daphnia magna]
MATKEPSQKKNIYGLATGREMWLKIETQYASNAADLEANCLTSLYNFKHDPRKDIMCHINGVLAFTNKLREIGKPMAELHIINIITSSLPESYARARSNWTLVPEAERKVNNLTSKLKAEETIIASYLKPAKEDLALHASEQQTDQNERIANKPGPSFYPVDNRSDGGRYLHKTKRSRINKFRGGRGAFKGSSGPPELREGEQEYEFLFCEVDTHKTRDCRNMTRAKKARNETKTQTKNQNF